MEEKIITWQQKKIFYRMVGKGKTVMLVHGFAEDGNIWDKQVDFLKDHFRLIVPDLPGSGRSELIENANIETYAEIIKAILDNESSEGVYLLGHSMGGYITLAFAEKYPQYLDSFGLVHSSAFADTEEKKQVRLKAIDFIYEKGANLFLKTSIPGLFAEEFTKNHFGEIESLIEKGKAFTNDALAQYYHAMIARPDRTAVLRNFNKPILFIIGQHDNAVPLQSSLQQCYLPSISDVHILKKSAHMGMWEETDKVNTILMNFLSEKL